MQQNNPPLSVVDDPVETAIRLLREAGLDFTVLDEATLFAEQPLEAAAA